ncbi:MAG: 5'-methylthioadenosine/adenosylhomocysteine nucleosidase [Duncaniella sp.]|nr:5'-methylthioadenosine/adenosylhomocysteine nucleosidase [Duncaniella sp.]
MKIAILAAMDKELSLLKSLLENPGSRRIDNIECITGHIGSHEVLLAKCGIGKVNAALNTLRNIRDFTPELVINSGVAGGAGPLGIGALLVAGEVAYHDVWCGPGTLTGAADGFSQVFLTDREVLDVALAALGVTASYGLIATGDRFISKAEEIERIHEIFPHAEAVDMESAAIAQVCASFGVPFFGMRVISDSPWASHDNSRQYDDFWEDAPRHSFNLVKKLLTSL